MFRDVCRWRRSRPETSFFSINTRSILVGLQAFFSPFVLDSPSSSCARLSLTMSALSPINEKPLTEEIGHNFLPRTDHDVEANDKPTTERTRSSETQLAASVDTRSSLATRTLSMGRGRAMPPRLLNRADYLVDFDGPDDPIHPFNWPFSTKSVSSHLSNHNFAFPT